MDKPVHFNYLINMPKRHFFKYTYAMIYTFINMQIKFLK